MSNKKNKLSLNEKYELYEKSVQSPESDIDFINKQFKFHLKKKPLILREDFCGTGYLSCSWTKQSSKHEAYGIDLDSEPLKHGQKTHFQDLNENQKQRMNYIHGNVLDTFSFKADIIAALNFSYFIFKDRKQLIQYFKRTYQGLKKEGALFLDMFGGSSSYEPSEEKRSVDRFTYYWECEKYNPVNNHCLYHIHFKRKGLFYKNVFTYDWRMWSAQEIRECLEEAGFQKSFFYWEGFTKEGDGDGIFKITEEEENCAGWVAYIVAIKT